MSVVLLSHYCHDRHNTDTKDRVMKLATVTHAESTAALERDGQWVAIPGYASLTDLFRGPDWRSVAETARHNGAVIEDARVGIPVPEPRKILCCGHNYRSHIAELGATTPEHPTLFAKFADTLLAQDEDIVLSRADALVDWEAELVVVVGASLRHASVDDAAAAIAGYTVGNDISVRDWQKRTPQWLQGKAFDATTPIGPVVVTADEFDPALGARISCEVNGEIVQDGIVSDLVFSPAELLSYISQFTRLDAGDLVFTGTPGGVGMARTPARYLADGNVVTTSIDGIGTLTNTFRTSEPIREQRSTL